MNTIRNVHCPSTPEESEIYTQVHLYLLFKKQCYIHRAIYKRNQNDYIHIIIDPKRCHQVLEPH